ncbi:hypothetical protein OIV83_003795 [Microbotryomycetes sp. JL201]|nr:hypothetical protein OIV83_003795 [Microbotryomycetes sp. JL201]
MRLRSGMQDSGHHQQAYNEQGRQQSAGLASSYFNGQQPVQSSLTPPQHAQSYPAQHQKYDSPYPPASTLHGQTNHTSSSPYPTHQQPANPPHSSGKHKKEDKKDKKDKDKKEKKKEDKKKDKKHKDKKKGGKSDDSSDESSDDDSD